MTIAPFAKRRHHACLPVFVIVALVTLLLFDTLPAHAQLRAQQNRTATSTIRQDETIVLFTTAARPDKQGHGWIIPIHAWVYRPQNSTFRKAIAARLLRARYGLTTNLNTQKYFDRRINLLLADNKEHRRIVIRIGQHRFVLPATGDNGHVKAELVMSADEIARARHNSVLPVQAVLRVGDLRNFSGQVVLIPPNGLSIISDIDDTVKLTYVTNHKRLFEQTFYRPFAAVPGMARLYQKAHAAGAAIHFVSSSPWHLYKPLEEFLARAGFPPASIHLKQIRLKDASILNLFRDGTQTKPPQILALLNAWPKRQFILIGDSGEKDPETYAAIMRAHPDQIQRIYIRNVTNARRKDARFAKVFAGIPPAKWRLFRDPNTLLRRRR